MFNLTYKTHKTPDEQVTAENMCKAVSDAVSAMLLPPDFPQQYVDYSECTVYDVPGCEEEPDAPVVKTSVYVPKNSKGKKCPVILYIPGGGLISASALMFKPNALEMAYKNDAVIVIPEYRTILKAQYPAPINDCHAVYKWIIENTEGLPIDTDNITIREHSETQHEDTDRLYQLGGAE